MTLKIADSWRAILRRNFTSLSDLADFLQWGPLIRERLCSNPGFSLNLPLRLAQKIQKGTLDDPILRQFVPLKDEGNKVPGFSKDPVGDNLCRKASKLLHKYQGRVMFVTTGACAMHCRYCFRQHFDYHAGSFSFTEELEYVRKDHSIYEIILSGGDPLSLSNRHLESLFAQLEKIVHVTKIRFHSRFPIGIPERIDTALLELIKSSRLRTVFVIHANHPRELDEDLFNRTDALRQTGALVLNQSVLLRRVNDSAEVLIKLCRLLSDQGIFPYYLHQLDRVQGASHFEVPIEEGKSLMRQISQCLPGYAVPKYVQEIAGDGGKRPINF